MKRLVAVLLALSAWGAPAMARSMEKECDRLMKGSYWEQHVEFKEKYGTWPHGSSPRNLYAGKIIHAHDKPKTDPKFRVHVGLLGTPGYALDDNRRLVYEAAYGACAAFLEYGFLFDRIYFYGEKGDLSRDYHVEWSSSNNYWILRRPWRKEYRLILRSQYYGGPKED